MPIPIALGIAAAVAGATGVGAGAHGAVKLKKANDKLKSAETQYEKKRMKLEMQMEEAVEIMDELGKLELNVLQGFEAFSDVIEKIHNRPEFESFDKDGVNIPKYDAEALKSVSIGAGILLGGLGGAALGTAGGFAAAGATTSAVMALGTASTGAAISSLSGVAATNATLAALGGGSLAAGGGGMALGTTVLGATTLGVGLLVGGVIFNVVGAKMSDNVDKACKQMEAVGIKIKHICTYLRELRTSATDYKKSLDAVNEKYLECFNYIHYVVNKLHRVDWNEFSSEEKLATENMVLLVGLLYKMCQVKLVNQDESEEGVNTVNIKDIETMMSEAEIVLAEIA